ncbi:DUF2066 domain-containing protein [Marinomonas transparens]|uniref:DUF2066 domain-containing protein n=1 Tax=Marinomonas transparens TaxID=2795388 RepID=A0A934N0D3_9GAMM|nr:DUF2066 domain-containing protein [Marinomonas transparens]MBJ7538450.1 DUF2066 domain-containing protein [Marinomonas transparens]
MNSRIFLLLVSVFLMPFAMAVPVKGLYQAEINLPATDSEAKMLQEAFSLAAQQVLVRVSGNKAAISGEVLQQAQQAASTWVAQHSVTALSELLPSGDGLVLGKQIKVTFYQESIDSFLTQNNLPVWGSNRPSVLIWLVSENNGVRTLAGSKAPSALLNGLAQSATLIGVPIYAPLLDDVDKNAITAADVWGFFEDTVAAASKRYQTDSVAAIRISNFSGQVSGSLLLLFSDGDVQRFNLTGSNQQEILDQASADLAKAFSSRYAAVRNNQSSSRLQLQVSGITGYNIMNKVQSYLESIGVVRDVLLSKIEGDKVEFSVDIDGDKQKLLNSIALNRLLLNAPLSALDPDANRVESFQYSGAK